MILERPLLALAVTLLILLNIPHAIADSWLMVSLDGENRIVTYRRDKETGELSEPRSCATSGSPGALFFDSKRNVLFAALRSSECLASYHFDEITGTLELLSEVKVEPDPAYVSLDKTGRWLFSAYYVGGKVAVHGINDKGVINPEANWYPTADKAHAALTDPSNRWLLVPHTGPNELHVFAFDPGTGKLTPSTPALYKTPPQTGPRHVIFHPSQSIAYTVNEQGGSVTAWRTDDSKGTLEVLGTYPTLPADYTERFASADIELTPNAKWLFASTRGHNSLACFRVATDGASLVQASRTPTEVTPRQFSIAPDGRYLYSAGQGSGKLATYRFDDDKGVLNKLSATEVGLRPWWVLAIDGDAP